MAYLFVPVIAALMLVAPAAAQTRADWHGAQPVTVEFLPGWRTAPDRHMAGIRVVLAPGWKTYWRAPGDNGIPPVIDTAGSSNLSAARLHFPRPEVHVIAGMKTIGYADQVVFPLELAVPQPAEDIALDLVLDFGVCEHVCIPVTARLNAVLPAAAARPDPRIAAALASRPADARRAGLASASCRLDSRGGEHRLAAVLEMPPLPGDAEFIVFEPANPDIWVGEATTRRDGGILSASAPLRVPRGRALALDRSALVITVLGNDSAVELRGCTD